MSSGSKDRTIDPRRAGITKRLARIERILVFASGKGGVGKSACATAAGLLLARRGFRTGLLDLDFQGASDHIFLGTELKFPEEQGGILPTAASYGLRFMSIAFFAGEHGVPMRGLELSNALLEILTVTVWEDLDYLVIDMPPGMGDEVLDLIQIVNKAEIVLMTSSSTVSSHVVSRFIEFCKRREKPIRGVIENMNRSNPENDEPSTGELLASENDIELICSIPFYSELETEIGNSELFAAGHFAASLDVGISKLLEN